MQFVTRHLKTWNKIDFGNKFGLNKGMTAHIFRQPVPKTSTVMLRTVHIER